MIYRGWRIWRGPRCWHAARGGRVLDALTVELARFMIDHEEARA